MCYTLLKELARHLIAFVIASPALTLLPGNAIAASLPREFIGVWSIASDAENKCKKADWERDRNDGMISVGATTISYWESSCEVEKIRTLHESTVEADLSCGGEGMRWRSTELFFVQKVGSHKQLVSVSLRRSSERDEAGRTVKSMGKHKISVSIFLECK